MNTSIDTEASILEVLDWEVVPRCESGVHPNDHAAEWSLTLICGHGALICTEAKDRCLNLLDVGLGYCPECGPTSQHDVAVERLVPIGGEARS